MNTALNRLQEALAARSAPLPFFVRDDDAGWADERLLALLNMMQAAQVPLDLAVIPVALGTPLAVELRQRQAAGEVGLHQHGLAHLNHEPEGRRCEFGAARSADQQRADLLQGRALLHTRLGEHLDPILTPPWNRVAPFTPALLAELGFAALSRDATAPAQQALPELRVHLDWSRWVREGLGAAAAVQALAAALARHPEDGSPFGLMLHHAVMDDAELQALQQALALLRSHPLVHCQRMRQALACEAQPC